MEGFDISTAAAIYVGDTTASAIYLGSNKLWPTDPDANNAIYADDDAVFTNVTTDIGTEIWPPILGYKNNYTYTDSDETEISSVTTRCFNVIDIDWNGIYVDGKKLNTTADLLEILQDMDNDLTALENT